MSAKPQPEEPPVVPLAELPPARSLHRKIARVMAAAERIPKNGKAPQAMGGFQFVQVGDVADAIRKGLAAENVTMLPSNIELLGSSEHQTKSGGVMTTESYRITWVFSDGDTGETFSVQSVGTGADTGDKAAPKAQTNAMKYGLLLSFLLSTGDDPELSDSSDRRSRVTSDQRDAMVDAEMRQQGFQPPAFAAVAATHEGGLIGVAQKGNGESDFELRQARDDAAAEPRPRLSFRLVEGRRGVKVVAKGVLADMLAEYRPGIEGQRVTLWGTVEEDSFDKTTDGKTKRITYQYVLLERLKVGVLDLAAPDVGEPESAPTADEEEEMAQLAFGAPA